jgi:hypothetical protein
VPLLRSALNQEFIGGDQLTYIGLKRQSLANCKSNADPAATVEVISIVVFLSNPK